MVIAVDFDGTIVEHDYPYIGKPIPFAIEALKKTQETGEHKLILWTVREGEYLEDAVNYCREKGLEFYAVNKNNPDEEPFSRPRKLDVDLFIDDRNLGGLPDWSIIYNLICTGGRGLSDFNELLKQGEANQRPVKKNFFLRLGEALDKAGKKDV
ncbi:hypothetical protein FACS1894155_09950 [Bacteroidia bacterium]|nr:hypothetical protein FACS189455_4670 [Bacteroidia bacterium]GHU90939.1 hypothetical protein FACS1894155_09950 [Bacteroidia bacterium]